MRDLTIGKYRRVRKDVARRLFEGGRMIYLTPSDVVADDSNMWIKPFPIEQGECEFDRHVDNFEYYNCCHELGYYTNFWISEDDNGREGW